MAKSGDHPIFEDLPYPLDRRESDMPVTGRMADAGAAVL